MERWRPGAIEWFASWQPPGTTLLGIEEHTALVSAHQRWRVEGSGAVWVLGPGGKTRFAAGADVALPPLVLPRGVPAVPAPGSPSAP
jgi:hypothetical protein